MQIFSSIPGSPDARVAFGGGYCARQRPNSTGRADHFFGNGENFDGS
jgi:hypothetical protein